MSRSSVRVIALSGELEFSRRAEIEGALSLEPGDSAVLVDFSEATYADSTTLAALMRLRAAAEVHGVRIAVVVVNRQFARLVQYAGLGEIFKIHADRGTALREISQP